MVAGIYASGQGSAVSDIAQPSGWTTVQALSSGVGNDRLEVSYKVADSSDVAASTFSWTFSGSVGNSIMIGTIVRATNYGFVDGSNSGTGAATASLSFSGFTPTRASDLYIIFAGKTINTTNTPAISTYAIATSNPTWTERVETTTTAGTYDCTLGVATATRPETTATGNVTVTSNDASNATDIAAIIAIAPRVDGSFSTGATKVNAYAITPMLNTKITANLTSPTFDTTTNTAWVNTDKPSEPTWTNTDK